MVSKASEIAPTVNGESEHLQQSRRDHRYWGVILAYGEGYSQHLTVLSRE